jgi:hypothetical protein
MDVRKDLLRLTYLNGYFKGKDEAIEETQEQIDRARRKYFDVQDIQLKLDRRQEALENYKKEVAAEKALIYNTLNN